MREHDIQNSIRLEISKQRLGVSFRTNVGQAYQGNDIRKHADGSITIMDPRPFQSGLPEGFSDLLVITPVTITPTMVGHEFARAAFIEVKTLKGKPTEKQLNFLRQMQFLSAITGIARSPADAIQILRG